MTATTPPMTAWYVLEVDGTGLASARAAEREKAERERERGGGCCGPRRAAEAAARPAHRPGLQAGRAASSSTQVLWR